MPRPTSPFILVTILLLACSERPLDGTGTASATEPTGTSGSASAPSTVGTTTLTPTTSDGVTDPGPTTSAPTGTGTTIDPTVDPTGEPTDTAVPPPDVGSGHACDIWDEQCPEGQKCMPVSLDGDTAWESLICVPIAPDPDGLGQPCQLLGTGFDGLDTCAHHSMCWNVDPDTGAGTCLGLCTGTPDAPTCADPDAHCQFSASGVLELCLPSCDPLQQDCGDGEGCAPSPSNSAHFICVLDTSGDEGQVFDPCEFVNACDPGLLCLSSALASECDPMAFGCCLPFCDLSEPGTCPGQDQECLVWFEQGQAPPDLENVGACALP